MEYYRNIQLSQELEEAAARVSRKSRPPSRKPSANWNSCGRKAKPKKWQNGGRPEICAIYLS